MHGVNSMKMANRLNRWNRKKLIVLLIYLNFKELYASLENTFFGEYGFFLITCTLAIAVSTPSHPLRFPISFGGALCFALGINNFKKLIRLFLPLEN